MISDKVLVVDKDNACEGLEEALALVEKTAAYVGFGAEDIKRLQQLADEMVVGAAATLDTFSGSMWLETEEGKIEIKLEMEGNFTFEEREHLIALTRDNKNTLPEGFFGKLGVLVGDAMSGEYFYPMGMSADPSGAEILWTSAEINQMMAEMNKQTPEEKEEADQAKQVLDDLADDITVSAHANRVLITVSKKLPK